ncbi:hypothetical protein IWZ00DRAFT_176639 [Phyllosticta capitalensis]
MLSRWQCLFCWELCWWIFGKTLLVSRVEVMALTGVEIRTKDKVSKHVSNVCWLIFVFRQMKLRRMGAVVCLEYNR